MADPATNLVGSLLGAANGDGPWDVATVTSATLVGGRVQARHDGAAVTLPKLRRYTPVVGDVVVLGRIGAALFIVDALG